MEKEILNLSDINTSDIKYEIFKFPDGQQDILITSIKGDYVEIKSRFNSWKDLELIVCATKALKRYKVKIIDLYIPYLLGSRSDRLFQKGGNSYLVDVIAPIINSLNFNQVTTIDVHSDVAAACINNLLVKSNSEVIIQLFKDYSLNEKETTLISPDAGAEKKIYSLIKEINFNGSLVVAKKHRDIITSKIISVDIDISNLYREQSRNLIIIDDICDGGRTFIELAKVLRDKPKVDFDLYLCVTHGIFSAGFEELNKYFDGIFCTNSIKDIADYTGNDVIKTNVKQLKVI